MRHAAIEFRSEHYLTIDGSAPATFGDPLFRTYGTGDRGFVRLHMNFPHHRENVIKFLGYAPTRASVEDALNKWDAVAFETAAYQSGCVVAAMRSPNEWAKHPQAAAVAAMPVVQIDKIGEAPPRPLPTGQKSLSGLRVLDLTRIIAGPVAGRALAAHGADVMRISAPGLPFVDWLVKDTGRGKLSAYADIATPEGRAALGISSGTPIFFCKPTGRVRLLRADLRSPMSRRSVPGSSTARSRLTATRDHGRHAAASTRWCRRQPASTPPRRKPPVLKARRSCHARRSTMRRGTYWLSGRSWRASAKRAKAVAGWSAFRWRPPDDGFGIWVGLRAAFPVRCHRAMRWSICLRTVRRRSAQCVLCGTRRSFRRHLRDGSGRQCRSAPIRQSGLSRRSRPALARSACHAGCAGLRAARPRGCARAFPRRQDLSRRRAARARRASGDNRSRRCRDRRLCFLDFLAERGGPFLPGKHAAFVERQREREGLRFPRLAKHRTLGVAHNYTASRYGSNASIETLSVESVASPHNSRPSNSTL